MSKASFIQASNISELCDPGFIETLVGETRAVEREPIKTVGFSGTQFERLHVDLANGSRTSLVLKPIHPEQDATVWRTGGVVAREARLLAERALDGVWDVFDAPYLAYAFDGDVSALLMHDLTPYLFADVRAPIHVKEEDLCIDRLARLHATFWQSDVLEIPWLAQGEFIYSFLAPGEIEMERAPGRVHPLFDAVTEGWKLAQRALPANVAKLVLSPPAEVAAITYDLPRTLTHGDAKVANFAILPGERVSGFDWANIAQGSVATDVGWYIAVNAARLTRSKEELIAAYRVALESHLRRTLPDLLWNRTRDAAILGGAMLLLWNKALNVKKELPGASAEWDWWVGELEGLLARRL